jgi:hypothetical protein
MVSLKTSFLIDKFIMNENNVEIFYLSIPKLIDRGDDLSSSSSDDSDVEVTSTINEVENELVQLFLLQICNLNMKDEK